MSTSSRITDDPGVPLQVRILASTGDGRKEGHSSSGGDDGGAKENVADLMKRLNLTEEEEAAVDFRYDDKSADPSPAEWVVIRKVLSPAIIHVNTVRAAMKPVWGNPWGLMVYVIGYKGSNMFVAEFGSKMDLERVMAGTPWMVGRHAMILKKYDERPSSSKIVFDRMELWARIINLPLGWMNQ